MLSPEPPGISNYSKQPDLSDEGTIQYLGEVMEQLETARSSPTQDFDTTSVVDIVESRSRQSNMSGLSRYKVRAKLSTLRLLP